MIALATIETSVPGFLISLAASLPFIFDGLIGVASLVRG